MRAVSGTQPAAYAPEGMAKRRNEARAKDTSPAAETSGASPWTISPFPPMPASSTLASLYPKRSPFQLEAVLEAVIVAFETVKTLSLREM